jgi:hypothetical protein
VENILFQILSTFSIVTLLNSKSGTCSLLFNISLILGWFEESYTASIPILSELKEAQVTPIFKKSDPLMKTNYRPVSVLPVFSKNFEKVYEIQLSEYFDKNVYFIQNIINIFICYLIKLKIRNLFSIIQYFFNTWMV